MWKALRGDWAIGRTERAGKTGVGVYFSLEQSTVVP